MATMELDISSRMYFVVCSLAYTPNILCSSLQGTLSATMRQDGRTWGRWGWMQVKAHIREYFVIIRTLKHQYFSIFTMSTNSFLAVFLAGERAAMGREGYCEEKPGYLVDKMPRFCSVLFSYGQGQLRNRVLGLIA